MKPRLSKIIWLVLLLVLPAAVQGQFNYATNNGAITITGYTDSGPGGDVTIPSEINGLPVTAIGDWGFAYSSLTSVTIPSSVISIGDRAFFDCARLNAITVDALNPSYTSPDGVLFDKKQATLIEFPGGKTGNYTIPASVTSVGMHAFESSSLTSVTIPSSVISFGDMALYNCGNLNAITVDPLNPVYSSADGVWFNKTQTTLIQYPMAKAGSFAVPNSVTNIGDYAFASCSSLPSITIPNSVISIGFFSFAGCDSLASITIPDSVTSIGERAFYHCTGLASVTIPDSVTYIGNAPFEFCLKISAITVDTLNPSYSSLDGVLFDKRQAALIQFPGGKTGNYTIPDGVRTLGNHAFSFSGPAAVTIPNSVTNIADAFFFCSMTGVYFMGNAPSVDPIWGFNGDNSTVHYVPGTTGWGPTFGGVPTVPWVVPPIIQRSPLTQTAEAGSAVEFRTIAIGDLVLGYQWFFNGSIKLGSTNGVLQLDDVQSAQIGAYTVVVTGSLGSVTSPPAILNVIPRVERRMVPGLALKGQPGSSLNLDFTDTVGPILQWTTFDHVSLTQTSQWYFDLSTTLPSQRFYRAWKSNTQDPPSTLDLHIVPALTLTGTVGSSVRVDYINQLGPTDAWVNLATVTLTNTSQLYFDTSAIGQPPRLWRILPAP